MRYCLFDDTVTTEIYCVSLNGDHAIMWGRRKSGEGGRVGKEEEWGRGKSVE